MFRISQDKFLSRDKIEHAIRGLLNTAIAYVVTRDLLIAVLWAVYFAVVWEIKDAVVPWEEYGWWGGDGFSWRDIAADMAGALLCVGIMVAL